MLHLIFSLLFFYFYIINSTSFIFFIFICYVNISYIKFVFLYLFTRSKRSILNNPKQFQQHITVTSEYLPDNSRNLVILLEYCKISKVFTENFKIIKKISECVFHLKKKNHADTFISFFFMTIFYSLSVPILTIFLKMPLI